jgi:hypothetical protein
MVTIPFEQCQWTLVLTLTLYLSERNCEFMTRTPVPESQAPTARFRVTGSNGRNVL